MNRSRQRIGTAIRRFVWIPPIVVLAALTVKCSDETPYRLQLNGASANDASGNRGNAAAPNIAVGQTRHSGAPVMQPNVYYQCPDCPPNPGNPPPPTPTPLQAPGPDPSGGKGCRPGVPCGGGVGG